MHTKLEHPRVSRVLVKKMAELAIDKAERFLDWLGEGHIEAVYLVGSRAEGTAHDHSDWDFLVVGDGFDAVDEEYHEKYPDQSWATRRTAVDLVFSSSHPPSTQKAIKVA